MFNLKKIIEPGSLRDIGSRPSGVTSRTKSAMTYFGGGRLEHGRP
jgi:hypothetical protein